MSANFKSKHGIVSKSPAELCMVFTDLRTLTAMIPEDKKSMVEATADNLRLTVQNFTVGVAVSGRNPYNLIQLQDDGAPFHFGVSIHFDEVSGESGRTDFHIEIEADLNLMMKMMLGPRIQEALDKIVEGLVAVSEGRMPEGMPEGMDFKL